MNHSLIDESQKDSREQNWEITKHTEYDSESI